MLKVTIPTKQCFLLITLLCYLLSLIGNIPISICTKMCVKYLHEII